MTQSSRTDNETSRDGASDASPRQVAIFAGGCFWCLEPVFREVRGVLAVEPGYTGGSMRNPTYEAVCSGDTGHAEAVRIEFDPSQVSYRELLDIFFGIHDPTTPNRQGHDVGTQYRSAIFVLDETQRREAIDAIARLESGEGNDGTPVFDAPIVTEVVAFTEWFPAESYHQRYYERNPYQGYCAAVISPKLAKFRRRFTALRAG